MNSWIGAVGCLIVVNVASAQLVTEGASQTEPSGQIATHAMLVEVESLPEDFSEWAISEFDGTYMNPARSEGPQSLCLGGATVDQFVRGLEEQELTFTTHTSPRVTAIDDEARIDVVETVLVVEGVSFDTGKPKPIKVKRVIGTQVVIRPSLYARDSVELQIHVTQTELNGETVLYSVPGQTITSPVLDIVGAEATFIVPQNSTLVMPIPTPGGEAAHTTMLVILSAHEVECDPDAE